MTGRAPFDTLPTPQQAGILSNDARFREYVSAMIWGDLAGRCTPTAAADYIRNHCKIASRAALATDTAARTRFDHLRADFDAWRGRIASPR